MGGTCGSFFDNKHLNFAVTTMALLRIAVNYVYGTSFLFLVVYTLVSFIRVMSDARDLDPSVSTFDVGIAWLKLYTIPLQILCSYPFFFPMGDAFQPMAAFALITCLIFTGLFIFTLIINDPSDVVKMQAYGVAIPVFALIAADLNYQGICFEAENRASQRHTQNSRP